MAVVGEVPVKGMVVVEGVVAVVGSCGVVEVVGMVVVRVGGDVVTARMMIVLPHYHSSRKLQAPR